MVRQEECQTSPFPAFFRNLIDPVTFVWINRTFEWKKDVLVTLSPE